MNDFDEKEICARIKKVRVSQNITIEKLASLTKFTKGYISQMENSEKAPPISTLVRIAAALNIDPIFLLTGEEKKDEDVKFELIKKNERKEIGSRGESLGYLYESLAYRSFGKQMEPTLITVYDKTGELQHEGEEFAYVLEGKAKFYHGNKTYVVLEEGDSMYFDSGVTHWCERIGSKPFKVVSVMLLKKRT
ncbi:MAG: cupin domain-containing protein [Thermodesulfobacteriota bacterium]